MSIKENEINLERRIEEWKHKLIDLTPRNKLLNFKQNKSPALLISYPDIDTTFNKLVVNEKTYKFFLPPEEENDIEQNLFEDDLENRSRNTKSYNHPLTNELVCNELSRKDIERILKNLHRTSKTYYQERGVRVLYMAFGFLKWKENQNSNDIFMSPLVLCPVELTKKTALEPYSLQISEDEIIINPALKVKLKKDFNIDLPTFPEDIENTSISEYLELVNKIAIPMKWNVDKATFLSLFSFLKVVMYQDFISNENYIKNNTIVKSLAGYEKDEAEIDEDEQKINVEPNPENVFQILDADSSQQKCIQVALKGKNFIMQGPPGTGKSQTIANIITEFIARGKTVLFVSEKIAALEVVFKRLFEKGIDRFCLELHSHKANKRQVVEELKKTLEEYKYINPINLPAQSEFDKLKQLKEKLNNYILSLHKVQEPLQESVFTVLSELSTLDKEPFIPLNLSNINSINHKTINELENYVGKLKSVKKVIKQGRNFPWFGCIEDRFDLNIKEKWSLNLQTLLNYLKELKNKSDEFAKRIGVNIPYNLKDVEWLIDIGLLLQETPLVLSSWFTEYDVRMLIKEVENCKVLCDSYWQYIFKLSKRYNDSFFSKDDVFMETVKNKWQNILLLFKEEDLSGQSIIDSGENILKAIEIIYTFIKKLSLIAENIVKEVYEVQTENITINKVSELISILNLCKENCKPLPKWLEPIKYEEATKNLQYYRPYYEEYNNLKTELLKTYNDNIFKVEIVELITKYNNIKNSPKTIILSDISTLFEKIVKHKITIEENLINSVNYFKEWNHNAIKLAELFGFPTNDISVERSKEVAKLFMLLYDLKTTPEQKWLNYEYLLKLENYINKIQPLYDEYIIRKQKLLELYDESFFSLDIDLLIEKFSSFFYTSKFRFINYDFYKYKKLISRTKRDISFSQTILNDLIEAREILRIRDRINSEEEQTKNYLGKYYDGISTDFTLVKQIISITKNILDLTGIFPLPEKLLKIIFGNNLSKDLLTLSKNILYNVEKWESEYYSLLNYITFEDLLKVQKLLNIEIYLESEKEKINNIFGEYYKGHKTNFSDIEKALNIANDLLDFSIKHKVSVSFIKMATYKGELSKSLISDLNSVSETVENLNSYIDNLSSITNSYKFITIKNLLDNKSLNQLENTLYDLLLPLKELCFLSKEIISYCHSNTPLTFVEVLNDLSEHKKALAMRDVVYSNYETFRLYFGEMFEGLNTQWDNILNSLQWTQKVKSLFNNNPINNKFIKLITQEKKEITSLKEIILYNTKTIKTIEEIEQYFSDDLKKLSTLSFDEMVNRIKNLYDSVDDLNLWIDFKQYSNLLQKNNLGDFLNNLLNNPPSSNNLVKIFRKAVYTEWVNYIFDQDINLKYFRGENHEDVIKEFCKVDKNLIEAASTNIIKICNSFKPQNLMRIKNPQVSVLMREAAKKRRHLPIRILFEKISDVLLKLKPCLLMSPLSVSQFLNPEFFDFDLVIFDEASQIFTEDAICSIYRGKQLIVAGDSKQLPPTNFFKNVDYGEDINEEDIEQESSSDYISVLDELSTVIHSESLRWHYRSKHESLIAFSNSRFYDNRLYTFPSAFDKDDLLGIKFVYVENGIYDSGGRSNNIQEAKKVANIVFDLLIKHPKKSIGVVAFSQSQMLSIEDEIELKLKMQPELNIFFREDRLEGFFVKNLENVQGDERDIIIFSICYGKDQNGKMKMFFGPLNNQGGEKRLNVAITRAREKVILVSSIKAIDIDLKRAKNAGALNLYHYLKYAESGILPNIEVKNNGEPESPLEKDISSEIKQMGYEIVNQVGCSGYRVDIGVIHPAHPGFFIIGIECDGKTYHSTKTARDRDRLRQEVLERLGWKIYRIWSPDWIFRRNTEINKLKNIIDKAYNEFLNSKISTLPAQK